ncbi:MAG: DUF2848 domain-containing protein [Rhodobacteraceae bacterium]|nr:DUF2848 domain-containing protein [Paracoccaceae bacterium]
MKIQFETGNGPADCTIETLTVAGWTGRDTAAVQHHIDELAAIGVAPPSTIPLFYRLSSALLTTETEVEFLGATSSGEAEPMLIRQDGRIWLGLASDHTDRELETVSVAASKQVCAKPCGKELWPWESVSDHVDELRIRSWIFEGGDWKLYQEGTLGQIRRLDELMQGASLSDGSAMLCGTFSAIGGVRPSEGFRATMTDPVTGREMSLEYRSKVLPVIS